MVGLGLCMREMGIDGCLGGAVLSSVLRESSRLHTGAVVSLGR